MDIFVIPNNSVFTLPDIETDTEKDRKWVVQDCMGVFTPHRDRWQHTFPLGSVYFFIGVCLGLCLVLGHCECTVNHVSWVFLQRKKIYKDNPHTRSIFSCTFLGAMDIGASSMIFWWRRWMEQSRPKIEMALPYLSARSCISRWRACVASFITKMGDPGTSACT